MVKNMLKVYRTARGLTQTELAEKSGVSRATISKIENNEEVVLTTHTIAKISEALQMDPSEIFLL